MTAADYRVRQWRLFHACNIGVLPYSWLRGLQTALYKQRHTTQWN